MKSSDYIQLILVGTLVTIYTTSRMNERDVQQQEYTSKEDCIQDWGDEESCTHSSSSGSYGGGSGAGSRYKGPRYYWDRELGRPVEVLENGNTRVLEHSRVGAYGSVRGSTGQIGTYSRGGFGSTARGFSAGG